MAVTGIKTLNPAYDRIKLGRTEETKSGANASAADEAAAGAQKKQDDFEKTGSSESVTYAKPKPLSANELMAMEEQRTTAFTQMLRSMIAKQGEQSNLSLLGLNLNVTSEASAKAAASIAEGGEYSVDAVATRIMDMAKALSGGDESKISILREAVQKGFKAAGVDLGGKLPSISQDTYTEVMERFDAWENGED